MVILALFPRIHLIGRLTLSLSKSPRGFSRFDEVGPPVNLTSFVAWKKFIFIICRKHGYL